MRPRVLRDALTPGRCCVAINRGEHAPRNLAGITCQRDVLAFRRDIRGYPCDQIFARRLILRRRY